MTARKPRQTAPESEQETQAAPAPEQEPAKDSAQPPARGKFTVPIQVPGGGIAMVTEEWAKRWPEDVAGSAATTTTEGK